MKEFIITSIIIFSMCFAQTAEADSLNTSRKTIGYDKIKHTAVSCLLTLSSQYVMENKSGFDENKALSYSISSAALVGLTKELNDKQTRNIPFDWDDMIANGVGIAIAILIITH
jgi:hypothetical protein